MPATLNFGALIHMKANAMRRMESIPFLLMVRYKRRPPALGSVSRNSLVMTELVCRARLNYYDIPTTFGVLWIEAFYIHVRDSESYDNVVQGN